MNVVARGSALFALLVGSCFLFAAPAPFNYLDPADPGFKSQLEKQALLKLQSRIKLYDRRPVRVLEPSTRTSGLSVEYHELPLIKVAEADSEIYDEASLFQPGAKNFAVVIPSGAKGEANSQTQIRLYSGEDGTLIKTISVHLQPNLFGLTGSALFSQGNRLYTAEVIEGTNQSVLKSYSMDNNFEPAGQTLKFPFEINSRYSFMKPVAPGRTLFWNPDQLYTNNSFYLMDSNTGSVVRLFSKPWNMTGVRAGVEMDKQGLMVHMEAVNPKQYLEPFVYQCYYNVSEAGLSPYPSGCFRNDDYGYVLEQDVSTPYGIFSYLQSGVQLQTLAGEPIWQPERY